MKRLNLQELLAGNKFLVDDEEHHITLNKEICAACTSKPCIFACPAGLYTLKGEQGDGSLASQLRDEEISFDDAGCLECGTCRLVCPHPGAIDWQYPRGTFGIIYRYG